MFYTYLDYPKIPDYLAAMCLDFLQLAPVHFPLSTNMSTVGPKYPDIKFARYKQFYIPRPLVDWLIDNKIVTKEMPVALVHAMYDGDRIWPHMDYPRTRALNYVISDDQSTTCFYRHLITPNITPSEVHYLIDPQEIELVESVVLEQNRWHVLEVDKIHNVTNLTKPRIAITVSNQFGPDNIVVYK